jgi:hypothetical protein
MKHIFFGTVGFITCFASLKQTSEIPGLSDAIQTLISLIAGAAGSVISFFLNKWLLKKQNNKPSV